MAKNQWVSRVATPFTTGDGAHLVGRVNSLVEPLLVKALMELDRAESASVGKFRMALWMSRTLTEGT